MVPMPALTSPCASPPPGRTPCYWLFAHEPHPGAAARPQRVPERASLPAGHRDLRPPPDCPGFSAPTARRGLSAWQGAGRGCQAERAKALKRGAGAGHSKYLLACWGCRWHRATLAVFRAGLMLTPRGLCPPWPGASRASCPGASSFSWCCQCLPLSLCHLWLHWLGSEGLASAPLCLPMPHPASLLTCWGSWGQCCPPSLSINLLGKHSLERGSLSVSLSVCPSMMVLPTGSHPGAADFLVQCGLLGASPPLGSVPA